MDWPASINDRWSAWDGNLEKYIRVTSGQARFDTAKTEAMTNFEADSDDYLKSPVIAKALLTRLLANGVQFADLVRIVEMIDAI